MGERRGEETQDRNRLALRDVLVARYDTLVRKLASRLGSAELADDALHDTYIRLGRQGELGPVRDPLAYLMRIASNIASDRRTLDTRRATEGDEIALARAIDDAPGPEQIALDRSEWAALKTALLDLPDRTREIFLAAWVDEVPYSVLAERHGVTVRTIQTEVKRAMQHGAAALGRK